MPRCTSTAASCPAATWSLPSPSARAALVGRAYLYGLMAGGERGVQRVADLLVQEAASTLALLGVSRVADLRRDDVRLRPA